MSTWQLELPLKSNALDRRTLTDVIVHLEYTAREGSAARKEEARRDAEERMARGALLRLFSLPRDFAAAWQKFLKPVSGASHHRLELDLTSAQFPWVQSGQTVRVQALELATRFAAGREYPGDGSLMAFELLDASNTALGPPVELTPSATEPGQAPTARVRFELEKAALKWYARITSESLATLDERLARPIKEGESRRVLDPDLWADAWLLVHYSVSSADGPS